MASACGGLAPHLSPANFDQGKRRKIHARLSLFPVRAGTSLFIVFQPRLRNTGRMSDHVYKKIEVVGSSPNGFEDAIKNALARAEKTVRNMRWFEVIETRGDVEDGKVAHWQVTLKIGFTLED